VREHVAIDLTLMADRLREHAQTVREKEALLQRLLEQDHVAARMAADKRVAELEAELARAQQKVEDLRDQVAAQTGMIRSIRVALNGKGRNPLPDHAHAIFQALASALPDHPLVKRVPGDAPERAALDRTELRFIYTVLETAKNVLGSRSCNDWIVVDPDEATLRFMQRVENHSFEGDEPRQIAVHDRRAYGPGDWLAVAYLQHLMEEVYGKETFEGTDKLGI